ncbi:unnamed protein product [Lampetra planeri]
MRLSFVSLVLLAWDCAQCAAATAAAAAAAHAQRAHGIIPARGGRRGRAAAAGAAAAVVSASCPRGCRSCSEVNGCLSCEQRYFFFLERKGMRQQGRCTAACPQGHYEQREPSINRCAIECEVGPWSEWGPCTKNGKPCGGKRGTHHRERTIAREPSLHGRPCPAVRESKRCRLQRRQCAKKEGAGSGEFTAPGTVQERHVSPAQRRMQKGGSSVR